MKKPGLNYTITKGIYDLVNNSGYLRQIPFWFGLVPYEIYVIPFMYLAILQVIWFNSPNDVQLHLLPHWFSFSLFQLLKGKTAVHRPGCQYPELGEYIHKESHCTGKNEFKSFPSGHTGIAFALATTIYMEMSYPKTSYFFEIPIRSKVVKKILMAFGFFVASMTSIHRISKGYHSIFDTAVGAFLGVIIGIISWMALDFYKKKYHLICEDPDQSTLDECELYRQSIRGKEYKYWFGRWKFWGTTKNKGVNIMIGCSKIFITIVVVFLFYRFIVDDLATLQKMQH